MADKQEVHMKVSQEQFDKQMKKFRAIEVSLNKMRLQVVPRQTYLLKPRRKEI